jgi:hypothetical protein
VGEGGLIWIGWEWVEGCGAGGSGSTWGAAHVSLNRYLDSTRNTRSQSLLHPFTHAHTHAHTADVMLSFGDTKLIL